MTNQSPESITCTGDITLLLHQDVEGTRFGRDDKLNGLIAGKIWDAAQMLEKYLHHRCISDVRFRPRRILELGSGTGYLGLYLQKLLEKLGHTDFEIIVTDVKDALELLELNVKANGDVAKAKVLDWFQVDEALKEEEFQKPFDLILVSDCVYFPHLFSALQDTLVKVCRLEEKKSPLVLFGYKQRTLAKESMFFDTIGKNFTFEPIDWNEFWQVWKDRGFVAGWLQLRDVPRETDHDETFWAYSLCQMDV